MVQYIYEREYYSSTISAAEFPNCKQIGNEAFRSCQNLRIANFPKCALIRFSAFQSDSNLVSISFPECRTILESAFQGCSNITYVKLPKCTYIGSYALYSCHLNYLSVPECKYLGGNALTFYNIENITISLPCCEYIAHISALPIRRLMSLYLPGSVFCVLGSVDWNPNSSMWNYRPASNLTIYVNSDLYSKYISAPMWDYYFSNIVPL